MAVTKEKLETAMRAKKMAGKALCRAAREMRTVEAVPALLDAAMLYARRCKSLDGLVRMAPEGVKAP